jgi:hypothetical protein
MPSTGFVGFDASSEGTRVVVQMLTEEKREELDLETLWGGHLKRRAKTGRDDTGIENDSVPSPQPSILHSHIQTLPSRDALSVGQSRGYHTSRRLARPAVVEADLRQPLDVSFMPDSIRATADQELAGLRPSAVDETTNALRRDLTALELAGDYRAVRSRLQLCPKGAISPDTGKGFILRSYLRHLERLSPSEARKALGTGDRDYHSTPFLYSFYHTIPPFPTAEHWKCRVDLYCHAIKLGHEGYSNRGLVALLETMQRTGVATSEPTFSKVVHHILLSSSSPSTGEESPREEDLHLILQVLQIMSLHNHAPLSLHTFLRLFPHLVRTSSPGSPNARSIPILLTQLPPTHRRTLAAHHSLLQVLLTPSLLVERPHIFWSLFSLPPRLLLPRSRHLYRHMFRVVATAGSPRLCADVLRRWVPEMSREDTPVGLSGELARAVRDCIMLVEGEGYAGHGGEWRSTWQQCGGAVESQPESPTDDR